MFCVFQFIVLLADRVILKFKSNLVSPLRTSFKDCALFLEQNPKCLTRPVFLPDQALSLRLHLTPCSFHHLVTLLFFPWKRHASLRRTFICIFRSCFCHLFYLANTSVFCPIPASVRVSFPERLSSTLITNSPLYNPGLYLNFLLEFDHLVFNISSWEKTIFLLFTTIFLEEPKIKW